MNEKIMKRTQRLLLFILVAFAFQPLWGQENVNAGGGDGSGETGQVSYTIGASFYEEFEDSSFVVTQGIQIPYEYSVITDIENPVVNLSIGLYPNPVIDVLKVHFPEFEKSTYTIYLQELSGKVLYAGNIETELTEIDFQPIQSGIYILSVRDKGTVVKTLKVIKN